MRSLPFLFNEAFVNLRRHGLMTVAAITTISVALVLIGSFALIFYQINVATQRAVGEFEMRVFCLQTVTKAQIPELQQRIAGLPGVAKVGYVSKEHAYIVDSQSQPLDTNGVPNLFPETFVVKMSSPERATAIASEIRGWHDVIESVSLPEDELSGVMKIANFLRTLGVVGGVVLLFGALVVVSNTVRISLFARRREIKIMQIVGASGWFIRLPLLIEGLIHGFAGGILAALCLALVGNYSRSIALQVVPMMVRYFDPVDMARFGGAVILLGTLIGATGSLLSMRRYLRFL